MIHCSGAGRAIKRPRGERAGEGSIKMIIKSALLLCFAAHKGKENQISERAMMMNATGWTRGGCGVDELSAACRGQLCRFIQKYNVVLL